MDARQLGYVVAVVDHGGFTRAAAALHVSQPALSQAIRTLEAELGVELFHRLGRGVRLTAAGEALLEPARQLDRDLLTARAAVAAVRDGAAGHLDLACLATLATDPVAVHIGRFRQANPGVTVRLTEPDDRSTVADQVRSGRSELGVTDLTLPDPDLISTPIGTQEYVALLPDTIQLDEPVRLRDLAPLPLVTTPPGTSTRILVDQAFEAAGVAPTLAVETEHREVMGAVVGAGGGYAIVPRDMAERVGGAGTRVATIRRSIRREIGIIRRPGRLSPAAQAFADQVVGATAT